MVTAIDNPKIKLVEVWMTTDNRLFKGFRCAKKHQARLDAQEEIKSISSIDLNKFITKREELL